MADFIDLVDASGKILKRDVPRSEANSHEGLHMQIVIVVVVDESGRLLVHRRAVEPNIGSYDHICGAVDAGESPEVAAIREATEETGIRPVNLRLISHGINEYNRYRYLFVGESDGAKPVGDPREVQWVGYKYLDELHTERDSGESSFVDGFFEDIERALMHELTVE